ncbi:MAG TPA: DciA family protein, partial [Nordella sp.]|nr:DciA family protein [Nordella sp.]
MKTLDKEFRALTRAAFARYGFAYADLITQWPAIMGEAIAQWSEPERIRWPRSGADERKQGGTLVIRVVPGRGLDLQHETPRIIERINAFYGYGAIASVKIMQGALTTRKPARKPLAPLRPQEAQALESQLETVPDP